MPKTFLILGGYGNTGFLIAKHLLHETDSAVIIAGRDLARAEKAATALAGSAPGRILVRHADASDLAGLKKSLAGVDMLVVAASCMQFVGIVARAAVETGTDYLDTQLSSPAKLAVLKSFEAQILAKNLTFITDGGFHPGLPAALVRYAATRLDVVSEAHVSSLIKLDWKSKKFSPVTAVEMIDEFNNFQAREYKSGGWQKAKWSDYKKFDFGTLGKRYCVPMPLLEMEQVTQDMPGLANAGFYVAGFNLVSDYIIMPYVMLWQKLFPAFGKKVNAAIFLWSLRQFSSRPFYTTLQMQAKGSLAGAPYSLFYELRHEDGYEMTAIPVVACLLQYLQQSRPGLFFQSIYVEPVQLLKDCFRMGINTKEEFTTA